MASFDNRKGFEKHSIGVVALLLLATCLPALGRTFSRSENALASSQSAEQQPGGVSEYEEEEPEYEPEYESEYGRGYRQENRPSERNDAKPEGVVGGDVTETVGEKTEVESADGSKKVEASEKDAIGVTDNLADHEQNHEHENQKYKNDAAAKKDGV